VGLEHGVPGILGSSLAGSAIMILGSFFMPQIRKLFPHQVTAVVVTMIGLSLVPVAVDWAAGGRNAGAHYGDPTNLGIALFVLATVIALVQFGKGIISAALRSAMPCAWDWDWWTSRQSRKPRCSRCRSRSTSA
jgi:NCS2 family nucleobase:cation symporter-2